MKIMLMFVMGMSHVTAPEGTKSLVVLHAT